MCVNGFPIKDFGNDDYCSYYLLGLGLGLGLVRANVFGN